MNLLCQHFRFLNSCKFLVSAMFGGRNFNSLLHFEWRTVFLLKSLQLSFLPPELEDEHFFHLFNLGSVQMSSISRFSCSFSRWKRLFRHALLGTHLIFRSLLLALSTSLPNVVFLSWDGELAFCLGPVVQVHQEFPAWNRSLLCLLLLL